MADEVKADVYLFLEEETENPIIVFQSERSLKWAQSHEGYSEITKGEMDSWMVLSVDPVDFFASLPKEWVMDVGPPIEVKNTYTIGVATLH